MAKFCSNCGKEVKDEQAVCLNCGVAINENKPIEQTDKFALVGFILGFVSIIAWFIPLFGYPVTICGIVLSAKGMKSSTSKNKALTGLILSIVFLTITFINSAVGACIGLSSFYDSVYNYY